MPCSKLHASDLEFVSRVLLIQLHGTVCFPFGRKLSVSALLTENLALHQVTFLVYGIGISTQRCKRASGLSLASYTGHVIIITFLNAEKESSSQVCRVGIVSRHLFQTRCV
jgi:hypothetical protein